MASAPGSTSRPTSAIGRRAHGGAPAGVTPGAAAAEAKAAARREMEKRAKAAVDAAREASMYFERYEKSELREALMRRSHDWLLSIWDGSCKNSTAMSDGLSPGLPKPEAQSTTSVSLLSSQPAGSPFSVLLIEHALSWEPLQLRELQQIIRELVTGVYIFNQLPSVELDGLPDGCASVNIPHAYQDTRLGQIMVSVAYHMQCLPHGTHIMADKRAKFLEKWHELSKKQLTSGGRNPPAGERELASQLTKEFDMQVLADTEPFRKGYEEMSFNNLQRFVGHDTDTEAVTTQSEMSIAAGRQVYREFQEGVSLQFLMVPKPICAHKSMFLVDADWMINSNTRVPSTGRRREQHCQLQSLVQEQRKFVTHQMQQHPELRVQMRLLKFATCVAMWLTTLRKQFLVPDVSTFLPPLPSEHLLTDRELPPMFVRKPAACNPLPPGVSYVTTHGGGLGIVKSALPVKPLDESMTAAYDYVMDTARDCRTEELFVSSVTPLGKAQYYILGVSLEKYYPTSPKVPRWIHAMFSEMNSLVGRVGVVTEQRAQDQFRRHFGAKKASRLKQVGAGLVASAERGLVSVFQSFTRRCAETRLKQVDAISGLSLMHHAALHDRANIVAVLLRLHCDIHQTSEVEGGCRDSTALHYAAQCGHLDTIAALLMHGARVDTFNADGFAPVHLAAMGNACQALRLLVMYSDDQLEFASNDSSKSTPLLLAVQGGCLDSVRLLIQLGADAMKTNASRQTAIHLAAANCRVNIMKFFTEDEKCRASFNAWEILADILSTKSDGVEAGLALGTLIPLSTITPSCVEEMMKVNMIQILVKLLKGERTEERAAYVLRLISQSPEVQRALIDHNGIPVLVSLLGKAKAETNCHAAVVLCDLMKGDLKNRQDDLSQAKAIPALVKLLDSRLEHVLLCAIDTLTLSLDQCHADNQHEVRECEGFEKIVQLLSAGEAASSPRVFRACSLLLVNLCQSLPDNQVASMEAACIEKLLQLVGDPSHVEVQTAAALAIHAISSSNPVTQEAIREVGGVEPLKKLMKNRSVDVKVYAATAVWAVAGDQLVARQLVASQIGIDQLVTLCELQNEELEVVGTEAICALGQGAKANQLAIANAGGVLPIVRLLRPVANSSEAVLVRSVQAVGTLSIGPAMCPNTEIQNSVTKAGGVELLAQLALKASSSPILKAKAMWAISCVALGNKNSQHLLISTEFRIDQLLRAWHQGCAHSLRLQGHQRRYRKSQRQSAKGDRQQSEANSIEAVPQQELDTAEQVHLYCGRALTTFAFGNSAIQKLLANLGGLQFVDFCPFMESSSPVLQAFFDFQVVVVSPILRGVDNVCMSVDAIQHLISLLGDNCEEVQMLAADCLASLAHTRSGIPCTIVHAGGVQALLVALASPVVAVMDCAASALGYLSFDATARRVLFKACRDRPQLARKLLLRTSKISPEFEKAWEQAKQVGIPSLSLEMNGGQAVVYSTRDPQPDFRQRSQLEAQIYSQSGSRQAHTGPGSGSRYPATTTRAMQRSSKPSPWYRAMQRTAEHSRMINAREAEGSPFSSSGRPASWRLS